MIDLSVSLLVSALLGVAMGIAACAATSGYLRRERARLISRVESSEFLVRTQHGRYMSALNDLGRAREQIAELARALADSGGTAASTSQDTTPPYPHVGEGPAESGRPG